MVPAYTVDGGSVPDQRTLDLAGYPGGFGIVGNRVNKQFQLDAFGESLLLLAAAGRHDRLGSDGQRAAEIAADAIGQRWPEKDAGHMGDRQPALDAQQADLRGGAAGGRPELRLSSARHGLGWPG